VTTPVVPGERPPVCLRAHVHPVETRQVVALQDRVPVGLGAFDRGAGLVAGGFVERGEPAPGAGLVIVQVEATGRAVRGASREVRLRERRHVQAEDVDLAEPHALEQARRVAHGTGRGEPAQQRPRVAGVRGQALAWILDPGDQAEERIHAVSHAMHREPGAPA